VGNAATTPIQLLGDGGSVTFTSLTVTGVSTFSAGTVSAPSITTTGDTNTGIFFPAADTIAFTEGGVESMRIDSSGNVGIGTSSIGGRLALQVSSGTGAIAYKSTTGGFTAYQLYTANENVIGTIGVTSTNDTFYLGYTSTPVLTWNNSGNVGIGTSSPTGKLDVSSASAGVTAGDLVVDTANKTVYVGRQSSTGGDNSYLVVRGRLNGSGTNQAIVITGDTSAYGTGIFRPGNDIIGFSTLATERMRISSAGDLSVGTTATEGRITVETGSNEAVWAKNTAGANQATMLSWNNAGSGNNYLHAFFVDAGATNVGNIDYNRAAGLLRYNVTSDATLKNIIGDSNGQRSLEILNTTRIRDFAWKNDTEQKTQIGVIAQELYETYKGAVSVGGENEEGVYKPWGVDKTAFTFHLIAGWQNHEKLIQEQQALIENLTTRLTALENK
jgi:hypothetical protein